MCKFLITNFFHVNFIKYGMCVYEGERERERRERKIRNKRKKKTNSCVSLLVRSSKYRKQSKKHNNLN